MNKLLTYITTLALLLLGLSATAQTQTGVRVRGNIFGGGNAANVSSKSTVIINQANAADTVNGDVYGGGALANVGTTAADYTTVTILNGVIEGNVYGGGLGDSIENCYGGTSNTAALVYGKVYVNIGNNSGGPTLNGSVFGCNNINGTPLDSVFVNIYKTAHTTANTYPSITTMAALEDTFDDPDYDDSFAIEAVYGGGNKASYKPSVANRATTVHVYGCTENTIKVIYGGGNAADCGTASKPADTRLIIEGGRYDQIFGGGNGYSESGNHTNCENPNYNPGANITGTASTDIQGGLYHQVFGGSNQYGDVNAVALSIDKQCSNLLISEAFGGANEAVLQGSVETNLGCGEYEIGSFYGGSNAASIGGNVTLNVYGGTYDKVFGGSKGVAAASGVTPVAANIGGKVTLNLYGGTIVDAFGGSDQNGNIGDTITVNVLDQGGTCALDLTNVYGASNQTLYQPNDTTITSPIVNVMHIEHADGIQGNVFGGGNEAVVKANPQVNIGDNDLNHTVLVSGSVFGGGNEAGVINTEVNFISGAVKGDIYGGCNADGTVTGDITVNILNDLGATGTGGYTVDVFGGGYGASTKTKGNVTVNFGTENGSNSIKPVIYGNLYGGSSQGQVGASDKTTTVNINNGTVNGNVFGGGLGVKDYTLSPFHVTDSIEALISGDARVNIGTALQDTNHVVITGNVYGGSNLCGNTLGDIEVHVYKTYHTTDNTVPNQNTTPPTIQNVSTLENLNTDSAYFALQGVYGGGNLAHYKSTGSSSKKKALVHVHGCDNSIRFLYGGGNAANTTADSLVIEGGRFYKVFGGGNGENADLPAANVTNGNAATYIYGGLFNYIFGGSNTKGSIAGDMDLNIDPSQGSCGLLVVSNLFGGGNVAPGTGGELTVKCGDLVVGDVYGGANMAPITGDVTLTIEGGTLNNVFGGSKGVAAATGVTPVAANIDGNVTLNLKGGTMINAFGGSDQNGNITGTITVNINEDETLTCPLVVQNIYGAGNVTPYKPNDSTTVISPVVNLQHMKSGNAVEYDVFGGGLGATAKVTANPKVVIGGTTSTEYAKVGRNVYGGGSLAPVKGNTEVIVRGYAATNDSIVGSVFGGGSEAGVSGTATVQVVQGTVLSGVYGGCNTSGSVGGTAEVILTGGLIGTTSQRANVYGGGLGPNTRMNGDVLVTIGATNGNTPPTYSGSAVITGDVYGGSAKGKTNCNDAGTQQNGTSKTDVTLYGGTIDGDLYGGGHGIDNAAANVYGPVQVTVNKGTVTGSVYGCNNAAGAPQSTVKVDIYGTDAASGSTYALGNVFGGGNQAAYGGTPDVTIHNCDNSIGYVYGGGNKASVYATNVNVYGGNTIGYVFGGGNGEGVDPNYVMVAGNAVTNIHGGTILHVFGGNNSSGKISGAVTLTVNKQAEGSGTACDMKIGEVYGGGNLAAGNAGAVNIGCTGDWTTAGTNNHTNHNNTDNRIGYELEGIGTVYGGANAADIGSSSSNSNITLNINSGMVDNVFGGNNTSGTIYGTIQVNINKTSDACSWYVGNVFGGGNLADYSGVPVVTLTNGPVSHNIYGGGNEAGVGGSSVNISGGSVGEGVYGGCNTSGTVSGNIIVNITGDNTTQTTIGTDATHRANIHGGGYGENTKTSGNVTVNFGALAYDNTSGTPVEIHSEFPKLYGDIYGGSALGEVNGGRTNTTTVNILNGELITNQTSSNGFPVYNGGNVFGGGLGRKAGGGQAAAPAKVYGTVTVNIGTGASRTLNPDDDSNRGKAIIGGNVYGCNNTNGSPQDSVTVNIYRTNRGEKDEITYAGNDATYALHDVFGGGNEADYIPASGAANKKLKVVIHDCYNSIERVFGGSNAAAAGATGNTVTVNTNIEGGRFYNVFGGGNGEVSAANIFGNVDLQIHGGIVEEFFVGSNRQGTISGSSNVTVDQISGCESVTITEFFCGGKYANVVGEINATIDCADALTVTNLYGGCKEANVVAGNGKNGDVHLSVYGGHYTNVFGGSKGTSTTPADIAGSVTLDLYGGTMTNVYGGSNINGNIGGTITVNVLDKESSTCPLNITNIYGGSNLTSYTPTNANAISPVVNVVHIKSGVRGNVYGASKGVVGTAATVTANPQVNIGYDADATQLSSLKTYLNSIHYTVPASPRAIVSGSVFGGGDAATVIGNTEIFLRNKAKVFGNVYGGGNMGEVTGNTKVIVNGQNN